MSRPNASRSVHRSAAAAAATNPNSTFPNDRHRARHNKLRIDEAIGLAFRTLQQPEEREALQDLLACVRERSPLLDATPQQASSERSIGLLLHLARSNHSFVRPPRDWRGSAASASDAAFSLANHLLARFPVPRVLMQAFYGHDANNNHIARRQHRRWFRQLGAGGSVRDLDLPLRFTRDMAHRFRSAPVDLSVPAALRYCELTSLGLDTSIARTLCRTQLGRSFEAPTFWRSFAALVVRDQSMWSDEDVQEAVAFCYAVRFQRTEIVEADRTVYQEPPQPGFTLTGRSRRSLLRMARAWRATLGHSAPSRRRWQPSQNQPIRMRPPQATLRDESFWEIVELVSAKDLIREGAALQHCVRWYVPDCEDGSSRIWSLRSRRGDKLRPMATIEIVPQRALVVQVRSYQNRSPSIAMAKCIRQWMEREALSESAHCGLPASPTAADRAGVQDAS